jgi:23S rRNA pseudouridine955/2504/2580 synthase
MKKTEVKHIVITEDHAGRRVDNFLMRHLKGVPKSRLYQMLRKGEVRVNSCRVKQTYRLVAGETVRLPPLFQESYDYDSSPSPFLLEQVRNSVIYEDDALIVLNKPSGIVVHSGSGRHFGVIEALRELRPEYETLELVHRLDRATSGCLIVAKDNMCLRQLHTALRSGKLTKRYSALLKGQLKKELTKVNMPLRRNSLRSGERVVQVSDDGKLAITIFHREHLFKLASLAEVDLMTGRTHQIRVHAAHIGHPLAGDEKYGDREFNKYMKQCGLSRMFLHASSIRFNSPSSGKEVEFKVPLPDELQTFLDKLDHD